MTPSTPQQAVPQLPNAPPPPPVIAQNPQGQKPGKKSATPSCLNSSALPSPSMEPGGKQLVGQCWDLAEVLLTTYLKTSNVVVMLILKVGRQRRARTSQPVS